MTLVILVVALLLVMVSVMVTVMLLVMVNIVVERACQICPSLGRHAFGACCADAQSYRSNRHFLRTPSG